MREKFLLLMNYGTRDGEEITRWELCADHDSALESISNRLTESEGSGTKLIYWRVLKVIEVIS